MKRFYIAFLITLMLLPPYLWWRGGMWDQGELPTHGMVHATGGAIVALVLFLLVQKLRSKQG